MKDRMGTSCGRMSAGRVSHSALAVLLALLFSFGLAPGTAFAEEDGSHYIFGKSTEYSTYSAGEELTDSFYYTDDWFSQDPYTAEAGSVLLDLKPSYLESLSEDTHTLTVQFDDGTAEATFKVAASETTPGGKPDRTAPQNKMNQ